MREVPMHLGLRRGGLGGGFRAVRFDRFGLAIGDGSRARETPAWIDLLLIGVLIVAVVLQGIVEGLELSSRVELLADAAALLLLAAVALELFRTRSLLLVPHLAIAYLLMVLIGVFSEAEPLRVLVSAKNFLMLPVVALALAMLPASERRARLFATGLLALAALQFAITIVQSRTETTTDLVVGSVGAYGGPITAAVILMGASVGLACFLAGTRWRWLALGLAITLPLFAIWGAVRVVPVVLPFVFGVVLLTAWLASERDRSSPGRILAGALASIVVVGAVVGGYALARPFDFDVLTRSSQLGRYLETATVYDFGPGAQAASFTAPGGSTGALTEGPHSVDAGTDRFSVPGATALREGHPIRLRQIAGASPLRAGTTYYVRDPGEVPFAGFNLSRTPAGPLIDVRVNGSAELAIRADRRRLAPTAVATLTSVVGVQEILAGPDEASRARVRRLIKHFLIPGRAPPLLPIPPTARPAPATAGAEPLSIEQLPPPGRLRQYRLAMRAVDDDPLTFALGRGLGAATYADNLGVGPTTNPDLYWAGLNDLGLLIVERGWLGLLIVAICALALTLAALGAARRLPAEARWQRSLLLAYPGIAVATAAIAATGPVFHNVASATAFWIATGVMLGIVLATPRRDPA